MAEDVDVTLNGDESRYEIRIDGELAGFAEYTPGNGIVTITHTEIDPSFEGRGLGSQLVRGALDDVRARGAKVVAACPFVKAWALKHADYADLLVDDEAAE